MKNTEELKEEIKDLEFDILNLKGYIRRLKFKGKHLEEQLILHGVIQPFYCWDEVSLGCRTRCEKECDQCKSNVK